MKVQGLEAATCLGSTLGTVSSVCKQDETFYVHLHMGTCDGERDEDGGENEGRPFILFIQ